MRYETSLLLVRWLKMALLILPIGSACAAVAKANVPFVRLAKIELKNARCKKIKNTEVSTMGVGLLRCQFAIWSLCIWSPVNVYK